MIGENKLRLKKLKKNLLEGLLENSPTILLKSEQIYKIHTLNTKLKISYC